MLLVIFGCWVDMEDYIHEGNVYMECQVEDCMYGEGGLLYLQVCVCVGGGGVFSGVFRIFFFFLNFLIFFFFYRVPRRANL